MVGTASHWAPTEDGVLEREIDEIVRALDDRGCATRDALEVLVGARYWGPGRFRAALREAMSQGRVRRVSHYTYAPEQPRRAG
jgi:hypothetical protein